MTTPELKKKLIHIIETTENMHVLEDIQRLLEINQATDKNSEYRLNTDQKEVVAEAREEIRSGNYLTNEQAEKDIDLWLKE